MKSAAQCSLSSVDAITSIPSGRRDLNPRPPEPHSAAATYPVRPSTAIPLWGPDFAVRVRPSTESYQHETGTNQEQEQEQAA